MKNDFKKGDRVRIEIGPIDKVGREGIVSTLMMNGCIVKFDDGMATAVKFEHLEMV